MSDELLPCPFCGSVGVTVSETSTFRWVAASCNECGAVGPEARRNTMKTWPNEAEDAVKAVNEWNRRPPASSERVGLAVGAKLFSFSDFDDWRDTAKSKFKKAGTSSGRVVCVDQKGRICAWGEHFIAAREEGAYPIDAFLLRQDMDGEAAHGIAPRHDEATGQINEPASGIAAPANGDKTP